MGEGNLDQLYAGAVLVNLLNIKEERGSGRGGGIYRVGLIGNPAGDSGPSVIVCNLL